MVFIPLDDQILSVNLSIEWHFAWNLLLKIQHQKLLQVNIEEFDHIHTITNWNEIELQILDEMLSRKNTVKR